MLQLDEDKWMRPENEASFVIKQRVADFMKIWRNYDWTQQLDGGAF